MTLTEVKLQTWDEFEMAAKANGLTDIKGGKSENPWPHWHTHEKYVRVWPNSYRTYEYYDLLNPDRE